ncbi:hypothetical protein [Aeromonas phage Akh-2]|nr:hypothetical protein [Aeromonas phage Akh-2]
MKLSKDELNELFVYDESSPTCLRWRTNEYGTAGSVAGYHVNPSTNPYIFMYGSKVAVALIVWVMHDRVLDKHKALAPKDGDMRNCRISNIQEVVLYQYPY